jgi:hypothetical protein
VGTAETLENLRRELMSHECMQQETIGKFKEFIDSTKGFRVTLFSMAIVIVLQVGTFLFLWGSLTTTVTQNTEHIWKTLTPSTVENTRNIDKILAKFELIQVFRGLQGEQGLQGLQGLQGIQGKDK